MKRLFFPVILGVFVVSFLFLLPTPDANAVNGGIVFTPTDMHFELAAAGLPTVASVQRLVFTGIEYRNTSDNDGSTTLSPGDTAVIDGVFGIASFVVGGFQVIPAGFNVTWELTGTYVGLIDTIISVSGSANTYVTTPNIGILTLYVGTDMAQQANFLTGDGFDDGIQVAQFIVQDGGGSYLIAGALDGSRDFLMLIQSALIGFFDPTVTGALFDSNLDADPDNNGVGGDAPVPTSWNYPVAIPQVFFPSAYFTSVDGSLNFGNLEPVCGDGTVDPTLGETCDPPTGFCTGSTLPRTACTSDADCPAGETCGGLVSPVGGGTADRTCRDSGTPYECTFCGDGVVNGPPGDEGCDDGNNIDTDACNNVCQPTNCDVLVDKAVDCGLGAVDNTLVKNNEDGTNGCTADVNDPLTVTYRVSNNGSVPLYNCVLTDSNGNISGPISGIDVGVGQTVLVATIDLICTDQLDNGEPDTLTVQCDCGDPVNPFATTSASDTASFECVSECGDGVLDPGEQCDPPGSVPDPNFPNNICRADCTYCGDGIKNNGEQCDFNDPNAPADCTTKCTLPPPSVGFGGQEPFITTIGEDTAYNPFYISPKESQFLHQNSDYLCESFASSKPVNRPNLCVIQNNNPFAGNTARIGKGNSGKFKWDIVLPKKLSGDFTIAVQCGILKPNETDINECAGETGEVVGPSCTRGAATLNYWALPTIEAIAYPGPFSDVSFTTPFHLTAMRNPSTYGNWGYSKNTKNHQVLDGSKASRIALKACFTKTIFVVVPLTGKKNALGEKEARLSDGDLISVILDVPTSNTVDIYCYEESVKIMGFGEPDSLLPDTVYDSALCQWKAGPDGILCDHTTNPPTPPQPGGTAAMCLDDVYDCNNCPDTGNL